MTKNKITGRRLRPNPSSKTFILDIWRNLFNGEFRHIKSLFKKDAADRQSNLEEFILALQNNELRFVEDEFKINFQPQSTIRPTARIYYFNFLHTQGRKTINVKYLIGLQMYDRLVLPMIDDDRVVSVTHKYFTKTNFTLHGVKESELDEYYKVKIDDLKYAMHKEVLQIVRLNILSFFNKLPKTLIEKLMIEMVYPTS